MQTLIIVAVVVIILVLLGTYYYTKKDVQIDTSIKCSKCSSHNTRPTSRVRSFSCNDCGVDFHLCVDKIHKEGVNCKLCAGKPGICPKGHEDIELITDESFWCNACEKPYHLCYEDKVPNYQEGLDCGFTKDGRLRSSPVCPTCHFNMQNVKSLNDGGSLICDKCNQTCHLCKHTNTYKRGAFSECDCDPFYGMVKTKIINNALN